jgi:hypothetical protein
MSDKRQHQEKRGPFMLALLAAGFLIAASAQASSTQDRNFSGNNPNPCNGDNVNWTGTEHIVDNTKADNDGTLHVNTMRQAHGDGVGVPSGLQYTVGMTSKLNGKFPPGPVIIRNRTKVNSQGPAQNFFETFYQKINEDGTPGTTTFESDCRG